METYNQLLMAALLFGVQGTLVKCEIQSEEGCFNAFDYFNMNTHKITVHLSCYNNISTNRTINVKSVLWLLPVKKDHCMDERARTNCSLTRICDCCPMPKHVCAMSSVNYPNSCDGKHQCEFAVESRNLDSCPRLDFSCESTNCHSRWVQVFYTCQTNGIVTMKQLICN